jgi:2-hydroxycyclohexanecarboxyl-CoA dehydrogenase
VTDKTAGCAVVTGAGSARGIGRQLATRLADHGWALGLVDVNPEVTDVAAKLTAESGVTAVGIVARIDDPDEVSSAVARLEESLPPVTALANIAGISEPTPFVDTDLARWRRVIDVNLTGTFLMTKALLSGMIERQYGRIVCLSSTAAQTGGGTFSTAAYAASKAGIEGMVRGLALEVAKHGVTANSIAPAIIDTDIMGGPITPERYDYFVSQVPVGRLGSTAEVAALLEFLIGPEAGYITGATVNINGGVRIG